MSQQSKSVSCGDLSASSRSLVVKKMSQLLFLLPQFPGKSVFSRPSGLRVCWLGHPARGRAWAGWGINKFTVRKDARGLSGSCLLLASKYSLSLSWNVKSQELGSILACKSAEWAFRLALVLECPHWGKRVLSKLQRGSLAPAMGIRDRVPTGITCSFALPFSLSSTILEVAGSPYLGSWTRILQVFPAASNNHGTVRDYRDRQTYLPVQDLVLVCLFVS